jgi:tetratricopeptide (TPR) repeat protein
MVVYWQVNTHEFINYDDQEYVTENRMVQGGLSWEGLRWAFTTFHAANWHPLTWLSHMLDVELFGMDPGGHHLSSLALHMANTLLLFIVLGRMTGAMWRSALVAALFALHPLHVESVAWVAERKDVLSTAFGLLALLAYHGYVRRPAASRYALVAGLYALSLMAKPMLVTLPLLMLLLDFWPLGRLRPTHHPSAGGVLFEAIRGGGITHLIVEKLPLLALSLTSSLITLTAQHSAMPPYTLVPLVTRLCNALLSYAGYLLKAFWPQNLAVFYPLQVPCQPTLFWLSLAAIAVVTALALRCAKRKPACIVGWLWYLGTLVPVIGIVQVGGQAMADRYTYLPLVGIFVMAIWAVDGAAFRTKSGKAVAGTLSALLLTALAAFSWVQISHWKNDLTLFSHAVEALPDNHLAHSILGHTLVKQKRYEEARPHLMLAVTRQGNTVLEHALFFNLGIVEEAAGRPELALRYFLQAARLKPDSYDYRFNAGVLSGRLGDNAAAVEQLNAALRIDPDQADGHYNLGVALVEIGDSERALQHYSEALRLRPDHADTHNNMGVALARRGAIREAAIHFEEALRLDPGFTDAQRNLRAARNRLQALPQP